MQYDLLHIQGKPFVLVPLHDYRGLSGGEDHAGTLPDAILDAIITGAEIPLKTIRKFRGYTQDELAQMSGISRPYIAEIETGKKDGSLRVLKILAQALDVELTHLA